MFQKVLKLFNDWGKYESAPMSAYIIKKSVKKTTKSLIKTQAKLPTNFTLYKQHCGLFQLFLRYLLSLGRSKFEVAYLKKQIKSNI